MVSALRLMGHCQCRPSLYNNHQMQSGRQGQGVRPTRLPHDAPSHQPAISAMAALWPVRRFLALGPLRDQAPFLARLSFRALRRLGLEDRRMSQVCTKGWRG